MHLLETSGLPKQQQVVYCWSLKRFRWRRSALFSSSRWYARATIIALFWSFLCFRYRGFQALNFLFRFCTSSSFLLFLAWRDAPFSSLLYETELFRPDLIEPSLAWKTRCYAAFYTDIQSACLQPARSFCCLRQSARSQEFKNKSTRLLT